MAESAEYRFDVFLSHNSQDKPAVIELAQRLKARGLRVWLDVWELRPGHPWQEALEEIIETTRAAAVLVGENGIGPWEDAEMRACLDEFARRKLTVVPVLLPGCPEQPKLPLLLRRFTWVDFRAGKEAEGFHRLVWGITGEKPPELIEWAEKGRAGFNPPPEPVPASPPRPAEAGPTPPLPPVQDIHGWPADKVQALQRQTAVALGRLVFFRDRLKSGGEGPEMAVIPAGSFLMGSPADEPERFDNEGPQHRVILPRPFAIGRHAVTRGEYRVFIEETQHPCRGAYIWAGNEWKLNPEASWLSPGFEQTDNDPVVCVSFEDVQAYLDWLNRRLGREPTGPGAYRLPTEAEWEYACRAGTATPFSFGRNITPEQVNYDGNFPYAGGKQGLFRKQTVPVGSLPANPWCLHEMHGNVWEWCADWFGPYSPESLEDPRGPSEGAGRVLRGGSWFNRGRLARSADRSARDPGHRLGNIGFRLVLGQGASPAG
jgi:formylglycine-generating enzyme required for sulfatase activity